jgi:hypothetical protein
MAAEAKAMVSSMFVLLQICPDARLDDDQHDPIEVIAVDASRERLEQHLTTYRERHRIACAELEELLLQHEDTWESVHDYAHDEIADKHRLCGMLVPEPDAIFEIFEVAKGPPLPEDRPVRVRPSASGLSRPDGPHQPR